MPSKSLAQARTMAAIAHGARLDKIKIPVKVAIEFNKADKKAGTLKKAVKKKSA